MIPEQETPHPKERMIVHVDPEIQDLIPVFFDRGRKDVQAMRVALKKKDYETIQRLSHILKGAGGGYGFDTVTHISQSLEEAAKARKTKEIERWVHELAVYLERVEVVYD